MPAGISTGFTVALVGCGHRCNSAILPTVLNCGARVGLIVEPELASRSAVLARAGYPIAYADRLSRRLLEETNSQAVIIASPSGLHFQQTELSLSCELATFVEKPMACTIGQARRLLRLSRGRLSVSEQRRHRADLRLLRRLIRSGRLGRIISVGYRDSVPAAREFVGSWRNDPQMAGGGVLLDLGYHTVGALQWLLDYYTAGGVIVQSAELFHDRFKVEKRARVQCAFGEVRAVLDVSLTDRCPQETVVVKGSLGSARVTRRRDQSRVSTLTWSRSDRLAVVRVPIDPAHDVRSLRNFLNGRGTTTAQLRRHFETVRILSTIYKEARR